MIGRDSATVAVVGGGPSGLAAAWALKNAGLDVRLYEGGRSISMRRHDEAADLATGIGGAGLFSDGKFSFYPSGSQLYRLSDQRRLRRAYEWCCERLSGLGIGYEMFPREEELPQAHMAPDGTKPYPAHYASLDQRRGLIALLCKGVSECVCTSTRVTRVRRLEQSYQVETEAPSDSTTVRAVVLATGRFGSLDIVEGRVQCNMPVVPLRYEFGIRVESHQSAGFLSKLRLPDVKRLRTIGAAQIRTFCTCRNGEIWNVPCGVLSALSGRSDGPPSDYSNFGLLARFEGDKLPLGEAIWSRLRTSALEESTVTYQSLSDFLAGSIASRSSGGFEPRSRPWYPIEDFCHGSIRSRVGEELYAILVEAIEDLLAWSPDLARASTMCLFPAVEGIGRYPALDGDLKVAGENIWCAGDVAGRFRGLIPSLVSGYYAGLVVQEALQPEAAATEQLSIASTSHGW
jgi:uncharacterized protein